MNPDTHENENAAKATPTKHSVVKDENMGKAADEEKSGVDLGRPMF